MIRKEAWSFYRKSSGVRLCWELEEPKGPKGCVWVEQLTLTKRDEKGLGKTLGLFTKRWEAGSYIWLSVKGVPTPSPPHPPTPALERDWYFIAKHPAPAPHIARPEERAALTHVPISVANEMLF